MAVRRHPPTHYLEVVQKHGGDRQKAARELGCTAHAVWENLKICEASGYAVPDSPYHADRITYVRGPMPPPVIPPHPSIAGMQAEIDDLRGQLEAVTTVKRWAAKPRKRTARKPNGAKHLYVPDTQVKVG